jgi:membrane protein required for beta-lactamase induction
VQQLPQVEVEEYNNQNYKNHSSLKHVSVQLVILDLFVSIGITQALRLVEHDLIDLLVEFFVVALIAPHGDPPHDQP